jgi:NitT/TauT family transport system substrate-binding protein
MRHRHLQRWKIDMPSFRKLDPMLSSGVPTTRRQALMLAAGAVVAGSGLVVPRPARAATKLRLLTNYYPEPNHGGYYQAVATGLYEKAGLDVTIKPGGPQINGMQLLTAGEADVLMGSSIGALSSVEKGAPVVVVMPSFQQDVQCLVTHPDVGGIADLKGRKILVSTLGRGSYWLWLKAKFGFTDDQVAPYTGNYQPFILDPTAAMGEVATSAPFLLKKQGIENKFFLLANDGYPPYGYPMLMMQDFVAKNRDVAARFVRASLEGWKSFALDPKPALQMILTERPDAAPDWLEYAVATQKQLKLLNGGDAATAGVGVMTDARWQELADFMIKAELLKPTTDWKSGYTLEFVKNLGIKL